MYMNCSTSGLMKERPSLVMEQKTTEVHTGVK